MVGRMGRTGRRPPIVSAFEQEDFDRDVTELGINDESFAHRVFSVFYSDFGRSEAAGCTQHY